jgi:hypothetical protein
VTTEANVTLIANILKDFIDTKVITTIPEWKETGVLLNSQQVRKLFKEAGTDMSNGPMVFNGMLELICDKLNETTSYFAMQVKGSILIMHNKSIREYKP